MLIDATASNTIIEALEKKIPEHSFGIALLTPDDFGYEKQLDDVPLTDENRQSIARQSVFLDLGILLGKLGRSKIAILVKGNVEKPFNISEVLYVNYNQGIKENGEPPINKLREIGINISDVDMKTALSN